MLRPQAHIVSAIALSTVLVACGSDPQAQEPAGADPSGATAADAAPSDPAAGDGRPSNTEAAPVSSVYALEAQTLEGDAVSLEKYEGKVIVFVNVASKCGYTKHYSGLQTLQEQLGGEDFAVVGIPSNDFGGQEPGSAEEIRAFCTQNYGVTFDMLAKTGTKEGDSPIFDRFAELTGERPGWNFCKFVVSKDGQQAKFFPSKIAPDSEELRGAIDAFMAN